MRLAGKVIIVTGAAGGQGQAVARRFAREGGRLVLTDLDTSIIERLAADIRSQGGPAIAVNADVTVADRVANVVDRARREFGALHVLYNNAGIYLANEDRPTAELSESVFEQVVNVNLKGVYLFCHHALPLLLESGNGVILNVGSVASYAGDSEAHAYAASKGGLLAYTRSLATKYGSEGIRANVICPGFIDTPMVAQFLEDPESRRSIIASTMLQRVGTPEDVANLATFLASDEAAFITGSVYPVDGGLIK